ncbi:CYFA0S15e00496g1_1 [Cyberlindnera fabianii]|uniref:Pre-mRNA-splicing factor SYF2 n=1 Tax=Cyberlindnera fabianii TaxID=36022 RepID=A0A061B9P7_CYBFA|nr:CYFA0S15e00496g1_1 [Cyberlindnera fabianii]
MSSPTAVERLAKLKQLQKRKTEAAKLNRQELFREHKLQSIGDSKLRNLESKQERALEELEKIETEEKGESWERKKVWDYSIEDNEKWEEKQALKNANKSNAGFSNYTQLAEQSYKKEISQIEVDKEAYKKEKEKLNKKKENDDNDDNNDNNDDDDDNNDFSHKPSKNAVNKLLSTMKGGDARRMQRRKNYDDTDNYINTKNKQFNEKLDRHYDKYT